MWLDPAEGSIHNYGSAIDLTIVDQAGNLLDMGTGYDHFGELAYPSKEDELLEKGALTTHQLQNRRLLREVMTGVGFTGINTEWWHFNAYSRQRASELFEMIPLLVAGCWLLVAGCWLLVAGCWLLVAGCWFYSSDNGTSLAFKSGSDISLSKGNMGLMILL